MRFKRLWGVAAILIVVGGFFLLSNRKEEQKEKVVEKIARPVKYITLSAPDVVLRRVFPGKVLASKTADLSFRVSGPLIELPVKKGEPINKGDLVAQIDPRDFKVQLMNAQSALNNAKAQLSAMRAGARREEISALSSQVASAKAKLAEAEADYKRMERLFKEGVVAQVDLERSKTTYEVAKGEVNAASQELQKAKSGARAEDIAAMEATIQGLESQVQAAQSALDDTELKAPFKGIIAARYVDNFQSVQKDQPIVSLQNLEEVEIVISIPEQDIMKFRLNTSLGVSSSFEAAPNTQYSLVFKEISTEADPQTQTYAVTFTMPYPKDIVVLPGMTANVEFTGQNGAHEIKGFAVPSIAVVPGEGTTHFLWIINEETMTVHKVEVYIHSYQGDMVIVGGNITVGNRVVTAGVNYLAEGDPVTFLSPNE